METVDTLVIGAGVVGLAIARELSLIGCEVVVAEKGTAAGQGVSARNSGVIHAGLYYPNNSLKARFCTEGAKLLYQYCVEYNVPHRQTGKYVVASSVEERSALKSLLENSEANGVSGVSLISKTKMRDLEPELNIEGALFSPSSGIIDVPELILSLLEQLETSGGAVAYNTAFVAASTEDDGFIVTLNDGSNYQVHVNNLVNAAGLSAQQIAANINGLDKNHIPPLIMAKGNYFQLSGLAPFKRLIYPLPVKGGLGIHATLDLAGTVRFGPDVQFCQEENYRPDETRLEAFQTAIKRYYPGIEGRRLVPDYAGIRPQIVSPAGFGDFVVSAKNQHGISGLINLFGIESPGLTSSLALAHHVSNIISSQ